MYSPPLIFGPIPPYSNVPINAQFYQPSRFVISDLAVGPTTIVTTSTNNNYVIGQEIRLLIPPQNGCSQLNEITGFVISIIAPDQVEINIDSNGGDPFVSATGMVSPQILAIGVINNGITDSSQNISNIGPGTPGAFKNISPN